MKSSTLEPIVRITLTANGKLWLAQAYFLILIKLQVKNFLTYLMGRPTVQKNSFAQAWYDDIKKSKWYIRQKLRFVV